jgi:hypothetical protein
VARQEARLKKGAREGEIVSLLNRGVSLAKMAAGEGVTADADPRQNDPGPTRPVGAEYLALQISRLNQALFGATGEVSTGNLGA